MIVVSFDVGVKNLAMCVMRERWCIPGEGGAEAGTGHDAVHAEILAWDLIDLGPNVKTAREACTAVVGVLRERHIRLSAVDACLIESQDSRASAKVKVLSHAIQVYFETALPGIPVLFYSASKKLQVWTGRVDEAGLPRDKHRRRKALAVRHALALLECAEDDPAIEKIKTAHKKDDLADSFLQGLHYLRTQAEVQRKATKAKRGGKRIVLSLQDDPDPTPRFEGLLPSAA